MARPVAWRADVVRGFGGFPDDYIVIDLETSGLYPGIDVPLQVALVHIRGRHMRSVYDRTIDWVTDQAANWVDWLAARLAHTGKAMAAKHPEHDWNFTVDDLRGGSRPERVMADIVALQNSWWVGHNAIRFDIPMIDVTAQKLGVGRFQPQLCWDTAFLEKGGITQLAPLPGESLLDFSRAVLEEMRPGVYYRLQPICTSRYDLLRRVGSVHGYGHSALYDATLAWHLFEVYRHEVDQEARSPSA